MSFVLKAMADGGTRLLVIAVECYDGKVVVSFIYIIQGVHLLENLEMSGNSAAVSKLTKSQRDISEKSCQEKLSIPYFKWTTSVLNGLLWALYHVCFICFLNSCLIEAVVG